MLQSSRHPVAFAILLLALPASLSAQSALFTTAQRAQGEAYVQTAAVKLAGSMKDPSSATFRNVFIQKRVSKKNGENVVLCGEANARNSYGGFTGYHKFMLLGDSLYVGGGGGLDADLLCLNNNPIIDSRDYAPELRTAYATALRNP